MQDPESLAVAMSISLSIFSFFLITYMTVKFVNFVVNRRKMKLFVDFFDKQDAVTIETTSNGLPKLIKQNEHIYLVGIIKIWKISS